MRNFLNNNYFTQKGQALVELATFGTVLLFCLAMLINFGLQANYQQAIEMKAFRQAMRESYNNANRGPNAGANVNLIEDKIGIDTQSPYGASERYPFAASAQVSWNNNLIDDYVNENDQPNTNYLPTVSYHINGQEKGPYTTADFRNYLCNGTIWVRLPSRQLTNGKYWQDVAVDCAAKTKVLEENLANGRKMKVGYVKLLRGQKEQISSIILDQATRKPKLVVSVQGDINRQISSFTVLDSQAGKIDTTIDQYLDCGGDLSCYANRRQGLLKGYVKTIHKEGTFEKEETRTAIITTTDSRASTETITREIKLRDGTIDEAKNNPPLPGGRPIRWTSPK